MAVKVLSTTVTPLSTCIGWPLPNPGSFIKKILPFNNVWLRIQRKLTNKCQKQDQ